MPQADVILSLVPCHARIGDVSGTTPTPVTRAPFAPLVRRIELDQVPADDHTHLPKRLTNTVAPRVPDVIGWTDRHG